MIQQIILLIFTLPPLFTDAYQIFSPETRPLLSFFVGSSPPSECILECIEPLKRPLIDFVNEEITMESKDNICAAYEKTTICMQNSTKCTSNDDGIIDKLLYGFNWACGGHGYDPFKYINPCIVTLGKEVRKQQNCTIKCGATFDRNLLAESNSTNLIGKLEDMCEPIGCFLNCTAKQMNSYCPTGGTRLINIIVSAFDELVEEYKRTTRQERQYLKDLIPEKCELYFDEAEMMRLRFDEQFVTDVFYMIAARKHRNAFTARSEAVRIVDGIIKNLEHETRSLQPLSWDLKAVSICAAIIVIMILNVFGLVFTIWWCVTSKEDNGEQLLTSEAAMTHFVEPNIRMKLKLPKLRTDAIHDSSPDVFELRVPRNGNQFHQNDEQTVVVPRFKRRRTYSVPLEPRPRTQSAGSDQLPQIVVVRNNEH